MNSLVATFLFLISSLVDQENKKEKLKVDLEPGVMVINQGYYGVKGFEIVEGIKKSYTGMAYIDRQHDVYVVSWISGHGAKFSGIGLREGNLLCVSWSVENLKGINVYKIENNRLNGRWTTMPGDGRIKTEIMTFIKGPEKEDGD